MKNTKKKASKASKKLQTVEITRSFTFKFFVKPYEPRDFFASQKAECFLKDAEKVSEQLHSFCRSEVMKSVKAYRKEMADFLKQSEEPVIQDTQVESPKHTHNKFGGMIDCAGCKAERNQESPKEIKKDKNYFISQAVTDKKGLDDNDNTNGAGHNSMAIHGEIGEANQTFNQNVGALEERQK